MLVTWAVRAARAVVIVLSWAVRLALRLLIWAAWAACMVLLLLNCVAWAAWLAFKDEMAASSDVELKAEAPDPELIAAG